MAVPLLGLPSPASFPSSSPCSPHSLPLFSEMSSDILRCSWHVIGTNLVPVSPLINALALSYGSSSRNATFHRRTSPRQVSDWALLYCLATTWEVQTKQECQKESFEPGFSLARGEPAQVIAIHGSKNFKILTFVYNWLLTCNHAIAFYLFIYFILGGLAVELIVKGSKKTSRTLFGLWASGYVVQVVHGTRWPAKRASG